MTRPQHSLIDWRVASALISRYDSFPSAHLMLRPGYRYYVSKEKNCVLAYTYSLGCAVIFGDPIGAPSAVESNVKEFLAAMRQKKKIVVFYYATETCLDLYKKLGYQHFALGSDAIVKLSRFNLAGKNAKTLRNNLSVIRQKEIVWEWKALATVSQERLYQVGALYALWQSHHLAPPLKNHYYPWHPEAEGELLTATTEGQLIGAFTFFPYNQQRGLVLDLMLRHPTAPRGLVEAGIVKAFDHAAAKGVKEVSLGFVGNIVTTSSSELSGAIEKALGWWYLNMNQLYKFKQLKTFKAKFNPEWRSRFLVYEKSVDLPRVMAAVLKEQF